MYFKHTISEEVTKADKTLEPFILKNTRASYLYSKNILKKRWRLFEKNLLNSEWPMDFEYVYLYSKNVLKKRWPEGENWIFKKYGEATKYKFMNWVPTVYSDDICNYLALYAKYVIKGRWKEAEKFIINSNQIGIYLSVLKDKDDIKEFKSKITLNAFKPGHERSKNFTSWEPTHKIKIKGKKSFEVMMLQPKCHFEIGCNLTKTSYYWNPHPDKDQYVVCKPSNSFIVVTLEEWLKHADTYISGRRHPPSFFIYNKEKDVLFKGKRGNKNRIEAEITKI